MSGTMQGGVVLHHTGSARDSARGGGALRLGCKQIHHRLVGTASHRCRYHKNIPDFDIPEQNEAFEVTSVGPLAGGLVRLDARVALCVAFPQAAARLGGGASVQSLPHVAAGGRRGTMPDVLAAGVRPHLGNARGVPESGPARRHGPADERRLHAGGHGYEQE
eukprot:3079237-Pyramimonas_sp.AAC.2